MRGTSVPLRQLCSDGIEGSPILCYIVNLANAEFIEKRKKESYEVFAGIRIVQGKARNYPTPSSENFKIYVS